ncbi:MAG TPA: CDP-archaeol synthase [Ktedonobacterales bacterium]|nr:CDP-archaeol synthase [Ktedonobacterales bacterium]
MQQSAPPPPVVNPPPDAAANRQWRRSLLLRVLTAVVGIPTILILLWFGGWVVFGALIVLVGWASYEMHHMLIGEGKHPLSLLSLALSLDFLLAAILPAQRPLLLEGGISLLLLLSFTWFLLMRKSLDGSLTDWALTVAVPFYIGWPLSFFQLLRGDERGFSSGFWLVLVVLAGVWTYDSMAFFAGRFFGRHKLATVVSPSKTWEGVIGGIIGGVVVTVLTTRPLNIPIYHAVILGVLLSIAGQIGDLAESLIKRQTHVKDSGHLVPGHGGILDRIDSQLFGVIVMYLYVLWVLPQLLS